MADTASLVARVKTDGAESAAKQLDNFAASAERADGSSEGLSKSLDNTNNSSKKLNPQIKGLTSVTEALGNKIAVLEEAQTNGARSAAVLAAQLKLGSEASQDEIKRVGDLTARLYDLTVGQDKLSSGTKGANEGLGRFRNTAGQVGYQVQDMVVQLQGGTSAFVAIGQQGSQLAGAFGPGGAVLGAIIALASAAGGVLYKALNSSKSSLEDVEKGSKELTASFQTAKDGTIELSDAMVTLSQNGDLAYGSMVKLVGLQAQQQLQTTTNAIKTQSEGWLDNSVAGQTAAAQLDDMIKKNQDVANVLSNVNVIADASTGQYANLAAQVGDIADKYGITTAQVSDLLVAQREFNAQPTAANAQKIADALTAAAQAATENKKELLDQAVEAQKLANTLQTTEKQLDAVTEAQKRNGQAVNSTTKAYQDQTAQIIRNQQIAVLSDKERAAAQAEVDKEAFAKRQGVTAADIAAYNKSRDQEAAQDIARINATEQKKAEAINNAAAKRAEAAAKRAANQDAQEKQQAQNFLDTVARQNEDELKAIDAQEQQKLKKLEDFKTQGQIVGQAYEDTKTQIMLDADTARQEELDKREKERQQKSDKQDAFIAQIQGQNATELELYDIQQAQKEKAAAEFRDGSLAQEEIYQQNLLAIAGNYNKKRRTEYASMLGQTTDDLKAALGEGNKMYKAFAIANAIMNTYQGAVAAFQSAAAIPIVGWVAAPIAAAAAVAAGLANVAKIRSAREQGGNLAAGQISTIAERNSPEVIMPAGASRVRTAQQMRQIMGESGSPGNSTPNVQIVNQTSGRVDSVTTEQTNENKLRIIIRETVSSDLNDSNSAISKSRRGTRGQPGF